MPRHLAIGDIHGCITALRSLIDFIAPSSEDTIVALGDYVDRGPDSRSVLDFLIDLGRHHTLVPLRGNHEIMMLDAREKSSWLGPWLKYGGDATLRSYAATAGATGSFTEIPDSHLDFLENGLRAYYECDSHFFVHAFADGELPLQDQSDATLYWQKFVDPKPHCSGKTMICGHSIQESGYPLSLGHAICIDTWAYGDGWLSCIDVDSETIWQANEAAETRSFVLGDVT